MWKKQINYATIKIVISWSNAPVHYEIDFICQLYSAAPVKMIGL